MLSTVARFVSILTFFVCKNPSYTYKGATTFSKLGGPISWSAVLLFFSGKKIRKVYAV